MSAAPADSLWETMSPEARRAAVVPLIAQGCTASGIAAKLGGTRSAVIGFCSRQGLTLPGNKFFAGLVDLTRPKNERSAAGGHATRKKAGVTLVEVGVAPARQLKRFGASPDAADDPAGAYSPLTARPAEAGAAVSLPPEIGAPAAPAPSAPPGGIAFLALTDTLCKRPLWPNGAPPALSAMFFCGAPAAAGSSYCRGCTPRLTAPTPGLIRQRTRVYGAAGVVTAR